MRYGILLALLIAGSGAQAATLAPDSLVCESTQDLEFVASQKAKPASAILKGAKLYVDFMRLHNETRRTIYIPKSRADEESERAAEEANKHLLASCAASRPAEVTVLERKAISGMVKVRTTYQGRPAELWTFTAAVTE